MAVKLPVKIQKIMDILPHRYPFLMVDKVIEVSDDSIVAIKNVTNNEPFFTGHFPGAPIMPGVMQLEALAQTAGLHGALSNPEEFEKTKGVSIGVFAKANNISFEKPVLPGNVLRLEAKITETETDKRGNPRRVRAAVNATVDGKITCQGDIEFAIVPAKLLK